jgi:excisionase family DNA binding protein
MPKELPGIGLVYELQEVAALLDVSVYTVQRDYRRGQLPGRKFGRRVLFTGAAIKGFLESGRPARRGSKGQPEQQGQAATRPAPSTREQKELIEKNRILDAMRLSGNYRKAAAKRLDISEVTLRARFKKYNLEFPSNRGIKS